MKKYLNSFKHSANLSSEGAMESGNHFKNGASPKSHTSRENILINKNTMKKILTIIMLCGVCCGFAQNTPRYAASTKTWKFGDQIWSDWINIPACDHSAFSDSDTKPYCRSYTKDGNTWYYYNWTYVKRNERALCPSPWKVPSLVDLIIFRNWRAAHRFDWVREWGLPGYVMSESLVGVSEKGMMWSTTEAPVPDDAYEFMGIEVWLFADAIMYDAVEMVEESGVARVGATVRCVR
jgi:hypothetical protein